MDDKSEEGEKVQTHVLNVDHTDNQSVIRADDAKLDELGYRSEFRREFSVSLTQKLDFMSDLIFRPTASV